MADGDHRASMQAYEGNQRALCLHCRAVHRVALSCACFRFGFRHEGDFALLLLNCPIVTTMGSPSAPAKLALPLAPKHHNKKNLTPDGRIEISLLIVREESQCIRACRMYRLY